MAAELGYATPAAFAVHFDGHISQLGTYGTLAIGVRRHLLEACKGIYQAESASHDAHQSEWPHAARGNGA